VRRERGGGLRGRGGRRLAIEGREHLGQEWGKGEIARFECKGLLP
jgi:hypothetical protein